MTLDYLSGLTKEKYNSVQHELDTSEFFLELSIDSPLSLVTTTVQVNELAFENIMYPFNGTNSILLDE